MLPTLSFARRQTSRQAGESALALYTFRIENGKTPMEIVNSDCASADDARSEALRLAAESIADFKPNFWLHPVWLLSVLDGEGVEIVALEFRGHNKGRSKRAPRARRRRR